MEKVYIFGHKQPDTDSVTSAISFAYLKNQLGLKAVPMVLGNINQETKFVLDYFHVKEPKYLNNVRLQIKDVNYHKGYYISENASILEAYHYMMNYGITGIPMIDEEKHLTGLITEKMLVQELVGGDFIHLHTTYQNIIDTLKGEEILKFDEEITGDVKVASYRSTTFFNQIQLQENSILIVGDRHSIIEYAVNSGIKMLILVGALEIKEEHLQIAKEHHVNIVRTPLDTFYTAKLISLSNYIKNIEMTKNPIWFDESTSYDDFLEKSKKLRHNNYPVLDKKGICLGLIRVTDITEKNKKKVILVDHNEAEQSVNGLEEAEILEVVDHHKLGDITTSSPINFRNMAVGSTNTILYFLYQESHIEIPRDMAGLMLSGVLSDTLSLTSPTTTELDRLVVSNLSKIAGVDDREYAIEMLKAGTSLKGKTKEEIIGTDFKVFPIDEKKIAIAQIFTFHIDEVLENKDEYLETMRLMVNKNNYDEIILAVTDILAHGSYFLFTPNMKSVLEEGYNQTVEEGTFIEGIVSRKKQIVPVIMTVMEGK